MYLGRIFTHWATPRACAVRAILPVALWPPKFYQEYVQPHGADGRNCRRNGSGSAPALRVLDLRGSLRGGASALVPLAGPAALPRLAVLYLGWVDAPSGVTPGWANLLRGRCLDRLVVGATRRCSGLAGDVVGGLSGPGLARAVAATGRLPRVLHAPAVVMDAAGVGVMAASYKVGGWGGVEAPGWLPLPPLPPLSPPLAVVAAAPAAAAAAACHTVTLGLAGMATPGGHRALAAAFPAVTTLVIVTADDVAAGSLAAWAPPPTVRVLTVTFCYASDAAGLLAGLAAAAVAAAAVSNQQADSGGTFTATSSLNGLTIRSAEALTAAAAPHVAALVAAGLCSLRLAYARGTAAAAGGEQGGGRRLRRGLPGDEGTAPPPPLPGHTLSCWASRQAAPA